MKGRERRRRRASSSLYADFLLDVASQPMMGQYRADPEEDRDPGQDINSKNA
jgi:hypothetical protein